MQQSGLWSIFILTLVALARFVECQSLPVPIPPSAGQCSKFGISAADFCIETTGYPTQINGINVDLYHYTDGWATPNPTGDLNIAAIGNGLMTTLPLFSTFAPPFNVTIALIKSFTNPNNMHLAETRAVLPAGTPCSVLILEPPYSSMDPSFYMGQIVAHELYHCVQYRNRNSDAPNIDGSGWWIEGSAEYFANVFYQSNGEIHMRQYNPDVPLYLQTPPYRASLFFQFLSNQGWNNNNINDFVTQQFRDSQVSLSERAIMSNNANLQTLFPIFAQKFSGLAITYPNGKLAQGNPGQSISETEIVLSDLQSNGQQHTEDVGVVSFAMTMYNATLQPGITYSIQWVPEVQDGQTVLAYQEVADISGNTAWATFDPASPIQIPVDCSSDPVKYRFLLTSTANEDISQGQLTFVRQSSQPCGCNDVGISLDPCLSGNWNLDLNDFQTYLEAAMAASQKISIANLVVSGASTFEIPVGGGIGNMTFDALTMDYNGTTDGYSLHATMDMTGSVSGQVVMQAAGQFCWLDGQGEGQANTSTTIAGFGAPIEFDVPLVTAYAAPTITINYTCSETSLQLVVSDSGQYGWALSYVKD